MLILGGRIINLASMLSFLGGFNTTAYTASKHAVMGLTRVMASEWGHLGINVNAIAADDLNAFHEMREQGYLSDRYLLYGHKSRCELYTYMLKKEFGDHITVESIYEKEELDGLTVSGSIAVALKAIEQDTN